MAIAMAIGSEGSRHEDSEPLELEVWERLVTQYPHQATLRLGFGRCLCRHGHFDAAAAQLECAVALSPEDVTLRQALVLALLQGGRLWDAYASVEDVFRMLPRNAQAFHLRGLVLQALGFVSLAADNFYLAVHLDRRLAEAWKNLHTALQVLRAADPARYANRLRDAAPAPDAPQ